MKFWKARLFMIAITIPLFFVGGIGLIIVFYQAFWGAPNNVWRMND